MGRSFVVFSLPLLVAGLACGDEPSPPVRTTPFTIWVLEERLGLETDERALAGVTVVVDGGGTRATKTTEPDGHATFDVDLSAGGVTVSAFTTDHTVVTMLDASPETARARADLHGKPASDLVIPLPRQDRLVRDRSVALTGAFSRKREATSAIDLSASVLPRLGSTRTTEATYELRVPRDRSFFLVGHELRLVEGDVAISHQHFRSFRIDAAPRAADATLDIDLDAAPALTTRTIHLRAELPGSPFDATTKATAAIRSVDSPLLVGPLVTSKASADGRARDIEIAVADTDVAGERVVTRAVLSAANGAASVRTELGIVSDDTSFVDFPLPPSVPDDTNRTLVDPIALDDFPPGADLRIQAFAGGQVFWIVHGPPGGLRSKTVKLPEPAGLSFSADVQLIALSIEARMDRLPLAPVGEIYKRVAIAPDLVVRRQ
jgi:hypothetical protein